MADNVFRFRRLKWGDPAEKLQMLPGNPPPSKTFKLPWEYLAIAIGLIAIVAMVIALL
jgi:hypothetical protein